MIHQIPTERIAVDVVDDVMDRLLFADIPVVTRPLLPESEASVAGPVPDRQLTQHRVARYLQLLFHAIRKRPLDRKQQLGDARRRRSRQHQTNAHTPA